MSAALNEGINLIDTANAYHLSQLRVGEYLACAKNRDKLIIESKVGEHSIYAYDKRCKLPSYDGIFCKHPASAYDFSYNAIIADVNTSLEQLHTHYLDVAFIHSDDNPQAILANGETVRALKNLQATGKIRHIGISLDDPNVAVKAINSGDFSAIELEYNLLNIHVQLLFLG